MKRNVGTGFAAFLLTTAASLYLPAFAQSPERTVPPAEEVSSAQSISANSEVYTPEFFERFAPQTASDMLRNIPGFNIDGGKQRRGFGQGGGNVLINGRRVTGKSNSALDELNNVSADQVLRIEIVDGATLDIPGLSGQVANVIKKTDAFSGTWRWSPQLRADTQPVYDQGRVSVSGETGPIAYTLGVRADGGNGAGKGIERVLDADGDLIDLRDDRFRGSGRVYGANGTLTWLGRAGGVLNLNGSVSSEDFEDLEVSKRTGAGKPDRVRYADSGFQGQFGEFGGDYEFSLGPGRLKVIGLNSFGDETSISTVTQFNTDLSSSEGTRFISNLEEGETIVRGEYAFPEFLGGEWQTAVEGAFNFVEIDSSLFDRDAIGEFGNEQPFAGSRVEEQRAEVSLSHNRQLSPALDLQASLSGEYSELSQTGGNGQTREFVRPKGFVSLAWQANEDTDLNMRFAREVGQLRFGDFVASTNIADGFSNVGNVNLAPEQTWVLEVEANRQFGDWGALTAEVYYRDIEDIVDQIPIFAADGTTIIGEAPGNIDSAWRTGLSLNGTMNFDPAGFRGAKIDLELEVNESEVLDPLTGQPRRVSDTDLIEFDMNFRHDVPETDWAWGVFYAQRSRERNFRLDQFSQFVATPGFAGAYVEHKDLYGMTGRLQVGNLLNSNEDFGRTVFVNRRDGPIDFTEFRSMEFANIFNFRLSGKF